MPVSTRRRHPSQDDAEREDEEADDPPDETAPPPGSVSHTIAAYQSRAEAQLRQFGEFLEAGLDSRVRRVWDPLFEMFEREADAIHRHIAG